MATGVTAESVLGSIIQGHLECSICHSRYQKPKMLDCSHSFCLKCLQELKQSHQPDDDHEDKITCPLCQRETVLPEGGVAKLNNNYTLISLVEEVGKQEQILKGDEFKVCQACDEENEAVSRCIDCEHYMCRECQRAHMRLASLKSHKITAVQRTCELVSEAESKKIFTNCGIHPSQKLGFYCTTCEQLICKKCTVSSHKDPKHMCITSPVAFDAFLQEAHKTIAKVGRLEAHVSRDWENTRSRLKRMLDKTARNISSKAALKVAQIRRQEVRLLQEANSAYRKKDKSLAEVIFAQVTAKKTNSEITEEDCLEILKLRQDLLSEYKDVKENTWDKVNSHLSFIACKEKGGDKEFELGTLKLEEKWELKQTLNVMGSAIATFSTGNIAIANSIAQSYGTSYSLTTISQNDQEEYYIHESKQIQLMDYPIDMATTTDEVLFLTGNQPGLVKVFNKEYQLLRQFSPTQTADIKSTPTCLAVDDSLIAVGYGSSDKISLHNPDGSLLRTLPAPMIDNYLTISNEQLIYTNCNKKKLVCLDYHGNNIFQVNLFQNSAPLGLCCDKAGDIFVVAYCQCIGGQIGQIHRYSSEGIYVNTLIKNIENNCTQKIAYIPNGKIVVTGNRVSFTQIYHRV